MTTGYHHGISLLGGWLPTAVELAAVILLAGAIAWRARRWLLVWIPVAALVGVGAALGARWYMDSLGLASDPAPVWLWVWSAAAVASIVVAITGWRGARWWRRTLAVLAIPLCVLSVGLSLDQWVGYFPTAQAAWGAVTAGPLPDQVDAGALPALRNTTVATGKVVSVSIPNDASGFVHRTEYVYLPPAWFVGPTPPALPVVMMIAGEFNTPADWIRSGDAVQTADTYAAAHGGEAPILVFVDAGGSFNNDTECVNGPRGNAADHLTEDVRPSVISSFGASSAPADWGIVGWSMGGTCAVDMTVMHPDLFSAFVDIAGDAGPTAGTKQQTIDRLYGGDETQWATYDPATVMAGHGPYDGVSGWFEESGTIRGGGPRNGGADSTSRPQNSGTGIGGRDNTPDTGEVGAAETLCADATAQNIACSIRTAAGGHTWQVATSAFSDALPWLATQIHVGPPPSPAP